MDQDSSLSSTSGGGCSLAVHQKSLTARAKDPIFFPILAQAWLSDESNFDSLVTPGLDWTRIFISLTAGAGTR